MKHCEWRLWYAWHPVCGVWLETVWRRFVDGVPEYRAARCVKCERLSSAPMGDLSVFYNFCHACGLGRIRSCDPMTGLADSGAWMRDWYGPGRHRRWCCCNSTGTEGTPLAWVSNGDESSML